MKSSNSFRDIADRGQRRFVGLRVVFRLLVASICLIQAAYAIDPNRAMSQYVRDRCIGAPSLAGRPGRACRRLKEPPLKEHPLKAHPLEVPPGKGRR